MMRNMTVFSLIYNEFIKSEAPCCENEVISTAESQADYTVVVLSCIVCSNKDNKFTIQCNKCNSWFH